MKRISLSLFTLIILLFPAKFYAQVVDAPRAFSSGSEVYYLGEKMTQEEEEKALKNFSAETRKYLEEIKKYDERKYRSLLLRGRFHLASIPFFDARDKKRADTENKIQELEIKSQALGLRYKYSEGSKDKIKSELTSTLGKLFELKEEDKRKEVKELEKELVELKQTLQFRQQNKDEIIKKRMYELIGSSDYFEW